MASDPHLVVIGAGPKAIAIAAKRWSLQRLGWSVPAVTVVDEFEVAAAWSGKYGYTDGYQPLGTPPDKDIGFPYSSTAWSGWNEKVNLDMLRFSWQAYKATRPDSNNGYAGWVDRGRPQPSHGDWGAYLRWVSQQIGLSIRRGRASEIDITDGSWKITCDDQSTRFAVTADALVITGPGPSRTDLPGFQAGHDRVMDARDFWSRYQPLSKSHGELLVYVIGQGETAASATVVAAQQFPPGTRVRVVSRQGVVYSRGESYDENRLYSDPNRWSALTLSDRREFVKRTDRGVFSMAAKEALNRLSTVETVPGTVLRLVCSPVQVELEIEYDKKRGFERCDYVVVAIGFNAMWFQDRFTDGAWSALCNQLGKTKDELNSDALQGAIEQDLAIARVKPRLHLPMLSGLAQGPGFPNLSCLGLLSDRVLMPYCRAPASPDV